MSNPKPRAQFYRIKTNEAKLEIIRAAIIQAGGNICLASRILEIEQSNLRRLMRNLKYPGYPRHIEKSLPPTEAQGQEQNNEPKTAQNGVENDRKS